VAKKTKRRRAQLEQERQKRQRTLLVVGVSVVAVLIVVVMIVVSSMGDDSPAIGSLDFSDGEGLQSGTTAEGFPYMGSPDAPVKFIEYSDYFCGHCKDFALETSPAIEEAYVETGQVQYITSYYALGKDARLSVVEAGACAADQGRFFEYKTLLFANQQQLGTTAPEQWKDLLVQYAEEVSLDVPTFESCWEEGRHQRQIVNAIDEAWEQGITSTPTFLINGQRVVGNQSFETFQAAIENALAGAGQ
jgi:protein-disulfide isomerase